MLKTITSIIISVALLGFLLVPVVHVSAQATTTSTTTPGTPNTGAGNVATNMALLLSSGAIAVGGSIFLLKKRSI